MLFECHKSLLPTPVLWASGLTQKMLRLKTSPTSVGSRYPRVNATTPSLTDTKPTHPGTRRCQANCFFAVSWVYLSFIVPRLGIEGIHEQVGALFEMV